MIGARLPRVEDPRLLRGEGRYTADLRPEGLLHVAFVRSDRGSARIEGLSLDRARSMSGIVGVFSAADRPVLGRSIPSVFPSPDLKVRMPSPLATTQIRYEGEPVVVVVADDPYRAADAVEAVDVEYGALPAIVDPLAALESGAPLVHEDVPGNVPGSVVREYGDVDAAFASADLVVKRRLAVDRAAGAAIETRTILAEPGSEGGITLYDATQAPHGLRRGLSAALEMDQEKIRVVAPDVGGGFGPKGRLYQEEVVLAALAMHLGRPLLWQATRTEDMLTTFQGRGAIVDAQIVADSEGHLLGFQALLIQDCGAYLATALIVPQNSAQHMLGPYRLPAARIEIQPVYTNKAPLTPLRGGGREVGVFVMERMIDLLGAELKVDPIEIRERNALRPDQFPYDTGYPGRGGGTVTYDSGSFPVCLDRARVTIGYDEFRRTQASEREKGIFRGIGLTLFIEATGGMSESARARLEPNGRISLMVGSPSNGQSHATTMAQICAGRLGVNLEAIDYSSGDTAAVDKGTGTFGSRMAVMAGNATAGASLSLREKILEAASDEMEVSPADLEIVEGVIGVRGVPDRNMTFRDLAGAQARNDGDRKLEAAFDFEPDRATAFSGGSHAAIVEVDVETGFVRVERYVVVHDCGTVINPLVVEGQVHGGVAEGLGEAIGGSVVYDGTGVLKTRSFLSYELPISEVVPRIDVIHQESPSPNNPEGIKGAGEGGTIGSLATFARAVEDALEPFGVVIDRLPIRPEWLGEQCRAAGS